MPEADKLLQQLTNQAAFAVSIRDVLEAILRQFKGAQGFAKELYLDFKANSPGHVNRVRIEGEILRALLRYGADEDQDEMAHDAEELKAILKESLHGDS